LIQFIRIRHQFGSTILFDDFSWHIKPNRKIGLIGPNGAGKTTLFQIANGNLKPDSGDVVRARETTISLFQQIPNFQPNLSVIETSLISNLPYGEYHKRKEILDKEFDSTPHDSPEFEKILGKQSELEDFATASDLHTIENRAKKILSGLGFKQIDFERSVSQFSPGYQHRLALAIALLNPHNLLLLDEPTNHLDDISKDWLIHYLLETKVTFLLVTHDPEFLNHVTDTIAEISSKGITEFNGSLEDFLEEKNEIHAKLAMQYKKEQSYIEKRMDWINRFRAQATKAKQVQSAVKKLEKREKIESPNEIFWNQKPDYSFKFVSCGKVSFRLEKASFQYPSNPSSTFSNAEIEVSSGDKIALVGPNGAGKSTLMRCIRGEYLLTSGSIYLGPKTITGYFSQTHTEDLIPDLNVLSMLLRIYPDLSEVAARTLLGHFSFSGDSVFKLVKNLSGGEQSRLRLAILVQSPTNILLLDEPTNHLDMVTRDALKRALKDYPGSLCIISHDPDFLKDLCNRTFEISGGQLKDLNCDFNDYIMYHKEELYAIGEEEKIEKPKQDYQHRNQEKNKLKRLQREIETIEIKIANLEKNKKDFELRLADSSFYQSPSYKKDLLNYEKSKIEIDELTKKWEELSLELE
jgi:ATP-binding cassette, subfamily F, member 3